MSPTTELARINDRSTSSDEIARAVELLAAARGQLATMPSEALSLASSALSIFESTPLKEENRGHHASALGLVVQGLCATGDKNAGLRLARKSLRKYRESEAVYEEVHLLDAATCASVTCGDPVSALKFAEEGFDACAVLKDIKWQAKFLHRIGQLQLAAGEVDKASKSLDEAQDRYVEYGDVYGEAAVLQTFAELYVDQQDLDAALEAAVARRLLYFDVQDKLGEGRALLQLASLYALDRGAADAAEQSAKEAAALFDEIGHRPGVGNSLQLRAHMHMIRGETAEAVSAAAKAQVTFEEVNDSAGLLASVRLTRAAHMAAGDGDAAVSAASKALDLHRKGCRGGASQEARTVEIELLLELSQAHAAVVLKHQLGTLDVQVASKEFQAKQHLFASSQRQAEAPSNSQTEVPSGDNAPKQEVESKRSVSAEDVARLIQGQLQELIDQDVEMDTPLMDAGLDSLSAISFRNGLQKQVGVSLAASMLFDYPTKRALVDHIAELLSEQ